MRKMIRFLMNFYAVNDGGASYVKYQKGHTYPADEETLRLAAAGVGEVIEVPDEPLAPTAPVEPNDPANHAPPAD